MAFSVDLARSSCYEIGVQLNLSRKVVNILRLTLLAVSAVVTLSACNAYPPVPTSNVERVERMTPVTDAPHVPDNTYGGYYYGHGRRWY